MAILNGKSTINLKEHLERENAMRRHNYLLQSKANLRAAMSEGIDRTWEESEYRYFHDHCKDQSHE